MNFILAIILFFTQSMIWGSSNQLSYIGLVTENSAIANSGIVEGDRIISINGMNTNAIKLSKNKYDIVTATAIVLAITINFSFIDNL